MKVSSICKFEVSSTDMNKTLKDLRVKSMHIYDYYCSGVYTLKEYQNQMKPLDDAIDKLEMQALNCHLQDTPASERSSLKHLH